MPSITLSESASVTLDANGNGTAGLGPDSARGPATWDVSTVVIQTSRPAQAPIPRAQLYLDQVSPSQSQGLTYDGSFSQGGGSLTVTRGSTLYCVWTGGQAGDVATFTVTGTKS